MEKKKKEAEEIYKEARNKDMVAEGYFNMYANSNPEVEDYERYKKTFARQYAKANSEAEEYRNNNKEILEKFERQRPESKHTTVINGQIYSLDDIDKQNKNKR